MVTRTPVPVRSPVRPPQTAPGAPGPGGSAALIDRLSGLFPPGQGCEQACIYCRDGSRLQAVFNCPMAVPSGPPGPVAVLGAAEDPYPREQRQLMATRANLEALGDLGSPVVIVTRSARIVRDLDILAALAREGRLRIFVAIGTLDAQIAHRLEPQADEPLARIEAIGRMAQAGLHAGVLLSPVIPGLTSTDVEAVLEAAAAAGAGYADIARFSLAPEAREPFARWLKRHFPHRSKVLLGLMQALGPEDSSPAGPPRPAPAPADYAQQIALRFDQACRRFLLEKVESPLCCGRFHVPASAG